MSVVEDIRAEVVSAFREVAEATGTGIFVVYLQRAGGVDRSVSPPATLPSAEFTLDAVQLSYSLAEISTGAVEARDVKFLLPAGVVEPTSADHLRVGAKVYEIARVKPVAPSGEPLYYVIQARG